VRRIFIALKNPSPWPGFETATFGSSGQHTNHYTTKAAFIINSAKNTEHRKQVTKFLKMYFSPYLCPASFLSPNILLST
jgi:hypothetical protein